MSEIRNEDLLALKAYITSADSTRFSGLAAGTVSLDLTHSNLAQRHAEIRFDLRETVDDLRARIHQKTGTPPAFQRLLFLRGHAPEAGAGAGDGDGGALHVVEAGTGGGRMLGYYSPQSGQTVHCIDVDPNSGSRGGRYENTALVEKYRMSDEEYDRRGGTLRDWGRRRREADPAFTLARHAREHRELAEATRQARMGGALPEGFEIDATTGKVVRSEPEPEPEPEAKGEKGAEARRGGGKDGADLPGPRSVEGIEPGMRCEVRPGGRRGTVAFAGEVPELGGGGHWVGVAFDEPVGRTDGRCGGRKYFDAGGPNRGGFVRGRNVAVGDFPERDILDELEGSSEDEL